MSYTSYSEARMSLHSKGFKPKPRKSMRPPEREIVLQTESIVPAKTTLILKPSGNAQSVAACIITDEEEEHLYPVSGRKYGNCVCREFHDASGMPIFELHAKSALGRPYSWFITMPGCGDLKIAEGEPRWGGNHESMKFSFRNMAANDTKRDEEKDTLVVTPCGEIMARYDIIDGDRRIAGVYGSIQHNDTLALLPKSQRNGFRPAMDLIIVAGVHFSLDGKAFIFAEANNPRGRLQSIGLAWGSKAAENGGKLQRQKAGGRQNVPEVLGASPEADQASERQKAIIDDERSKYSENLEQLWESMIQMMSRIDQLKAQENKSLDGKSEVGKQLPQIKQALDAARTTNQHHVAWDNIFGVLLRAQRSLITTAIVFGKMLELLQDKRSASSTL